MYAAWVRANCGDSDAVRTSARFDVGEWMRKLWFAAAIAALPALTVAFAAPGAGMGGMGNETVNYSYDALGRLVNTSTANGPNNGTVMQTCFDPAGNRKRYDVVTPGAAPTPCPTTTP